MHDRVYRYRAIRNRYKAGSIKASIPDPSYVRPNLRAVLDEKNISDDDYSFRKISKKRLIDKEKLNTTKTLRQVSIHLENISKSRNDKLEQVLQFIQRHEKTKQNIQKPVPVDSSILKLGRKKQSLRKVVLLREHRKQYGKRFILSPNESYV